LCFSEVISTSDHSFFEMAQTARPPIKTVICSGTPAEIGFQHGTAAAAEVHRNVQTYTAFFWETVQISWEEARNRATAQFVSTLSARYPEVLEEMAGIAAGAGRGLTRDDILTLNVRSEIALTNYTDGCTALSQTGRDGEMFLAQNWDWLEELHEGMILLDLRPKGSGVRLVFLGEGGIVGKIGMNSAGFGQCMNALRSGSFSGSNFPVHVMSRYLLQHASCVDDALAMIKKFGVASTTNFMFADRSGKHIDIECSPRGNTIIAPSDGFVAHTNHLCGLDRPAGLVDHPAANSFARLSRIQMLTQADVVAGTVTTFESLRRRLSDQEGTPFSICRNKPPGAVGMERMTTLACIMMELRSGTGKILIGRPCDDVEVVEWSLSLKPQDHKL
jgi:isopenicillin-N N-acyltransferase like protein